MHFSALDDRRAVCRVRDVAHHQVIRVRSCLLFFFNVTATTEIYTLSLHDALPICEVDRLRARRLRCLRGPRQVELPRSEEHTSELQSRGHLVCRLLLEKKKKK